MFSNKNKTLYNVRYFAPRLMIYDCFTFFNELEVLDIRLNELNSVVDKFVLVESTVTFTNKKKKLFYKENKNLFRKFNHKIIHIVVDDSPDVYGNPWIIEHFQTAAISRGLKNCKPNDVILISCVDEIPDRRVITEYKNNNSVNIGFSQYLFYYYLNYLRVDEPFMGTRMIKYKNLKKFSDTYLVRYSKPDLIIYKSGWHFSFLGGIKRIRTKLMSYSHQEFNNPTYNTTEKIWASVVSGKDIFGKGIRFKRVGYSLLPKYVQDNPKKFKKNLIDPTGNYSSYLQLSYVIAKGLEFGRKGLRVIKKWK